jgi:eukaryotic-like serine/threonine-protein kinase
MADWLGKTVGKVRIEKYLARGGWGEVYLGTHLTLDRPVAVKVLHSYIEQDPDLLMRFQREAKVVAGLRHPNIVQVFDFDAIDGHPYIVMEYLKGPSLATYLRGLHKRNERVPYDQIARLLKSLSAGLDYAHDKDVIHRDIKPENIMIHGKAGEVPLDKPLTDDVEPVIMDFGLVRIANTASQTTAKVISGTPAYMSPEQARGDQTDRRTDIYSLGVVLYEMVAGCVPFEADSTFSLIYQQINIPPPPIPEISPAVQKVIDRALSKNQTDRYPTAGELAADFALAIGMTAEPITTAVHLPEEPKPVVADIPEKPENMLVQLTGASTTPHPATFVEPKPAGRKSNRIGIVIFSLAGLFVLAMFGFAIGAFFILPRLSSSSTATAPAVSASVTIPATSSVVTGVQKTESVIPTAGSTPTEASRLPNAEGMVQIAAGSYEVGSTSADEYHNARLNINLKSFWIDKYQVTAEQYQQYLDATGAETPTVVGEGKHPVRGVAWDQAVAYCSWVNKRLPTEAEWEAAGRGPGSNPQLYPWGNDPKAGGQVDSLPDQDTYEVGAFPFNVSPLGVYDMVGNIWEWVGEPYASIPAGSMILRGGRFGLPILDLAYRLSVESSDTRYQKFAGFRCAADQVK